MRMKEGNKVLFIILFLLAADFYWSLAQAQETKVLIVRLSGTVLVESAKGDWKPARKWMYLSDGSHLKTLVGSSLDLMLNKGALIRIKGESEFSLGHVLKGVEEALETAKPGFCSKDRCKNGTVIRLLKGKAFFYVTPGFMGLPFIVDTPLGIAGVTGTRFAVEISKNRQLIVAVYQGQVVVWQRHIAKKIVLVGPGFITRVMSGKPPESPSSMTEKERKQYEECLRLHFGLEKNQAFIETSGRYRGVFSRGYSPEVLSEFGPTRTYQHQYQDGATSVGSEYSGRVTYGANKKGGSSSKVGNGDHHSSMSDRHSSTMDSHIKMDHHDMTDRHTVKDHVSMDKKTMSSGHSMTDHSTVNRSIKHSVPSRHEMSTPHPSMPTSSMTGSHTTTRSTTPTHSGTGHKR